MLLFLTSMKSKQMTILGGLEIIIHAQIIRSPFGWRVRRKRVIRETKS